MGIQSGENAAARWGSLSEYLDHGLGLTDTQRKAWLAELHQREPGIAHELEQLFALREGERFADFLDEAAAPVAAGWTATLVGRQVGPYRIEAEAGRGGMGSVWRARRIDGRYQGLVAIKLVHASWIGQGAEERFRTEGHLLARLEHAHIARLLDAGVLEGTQPYLVLEYVEGVPIDEYCRLHALGVAARIRLFLDVLEAVAHAHSHLIVHRDLKPGNIFVTHAGVVKLLDFGIGKLLEGERGPGAPTRSGASALTPQYAAPEQLTGDAVTTGTDIYTLGVVLYVLLTGRLPFTDDCGSRVEFIQAVVTRDPPRPSAVAGLATIPRRSLSGELDNILGKALKKDPRDRYLSVTDFADDLRRLLNHEPVHAHADTVGYRVAKFVRRHRGSVLGAALTALALLGTTAFALWQMYEARAQRDLANYEAAHLSAQSELMEFLLGDSQASPQVMAQRLEHARALVQRRFSDNPAVQAQLLMPLSGRYVDIGDMTGSAVLMQEAEALAARLDDPHLIADVACGKAQDAVDANDMRAAHAQAAIAQANLKRLTTVPTGLVAECAMSTAYIAQREGDFAVAVAATQDAMQALEAAHLQRSPRYTSVAHEYARSLAAAGRYHDAWAAEEAVMSIVASVGRDNTSGYFAMLNVGVQALLNGGQPRRALEVLDSRESAIRRNNPDVQLPFYLGATRLLLQSAAAPTPAADQGLMEAAKTAEEQGLGLVIPIYRAGAIRAALDRGDVTRAESYWPSLSDRERHLEDAAGRRDALRALVTHALLDLGRHDAQAADADVTRAAALVPAAQRAADPDWRRVTIVRAQAEYALGQYAAASADADAAIASARRGAIDPDSSAWVGEALVWRARSELALGQAAAARASAREAMPHLQRNLDPTHPLIKSAASLATTAT